MVTLTLQCNGDKNKISSIKVYLDVIKSYLKDFIRNLRKSDTWNIELTLINTNTN